MMLLVVWIQSWLACQGMGIGDENLRDHMSFVAIQRKFCLVVNGDKD